MNKPLTQIEALRQRLTGDDLALLERSLTLPWYKLRPDDAADPALRDYLNSCWRHGALREEYDSFGSC